MDVSNFGFKNIPVIYSILWNILRKFLLVFRVEKELQCACRSPKQKKKERLDTINRGYLGGLWVKGDEGWNGEKVIRHFNNGRITVHNEARSGSPVVNNGLVGKVRDEIRKNRRFTIILLCDEFPQRAVQQWLSL
ncbi:hypothetical protein TNCV_3831461 [Trichonephila clavipes]|nr:hypothetical protein TNCV_3831461 [Trichonephila clavipes]